MARLPYEERVKIWFVPTLTDPASPSLAEITAGTELTTFVAKDGFNPGVTNNTMDTAGIDSAFDAVEPGSFGAALTLTCFRDDTTDTAFLTLVRDARGHIVVGNDSPTGIAVGDIVDVYQVAMQTPVMQASATNTAQRFNAEAAVHAEPDLGVTVVS